MDTNAAWIKNTISIKIDKQTNAALFQGAKY